MWVELSRRAAALVYLLPLGLLLAVCLAAQSLGGVWMAMLGAAAFAVGLIPALLWNRHLRRRPMEFRITGRVTSMFGYAAARPPSPEEAQVRYHAACAAR